jgi:DNA-binding transcriptional regulator YhcF (GntR family)
MTNFEEMIKEMQNTGLSEEEIQEYIEENYPNN